MTASYPLQEASAKLPALFEEAADHLVCIRDGSRVLGYLTAPDRIENWPELEGELETHALLSDPSAMKALHDAATGQTSYQSLDEPGGGV